MARRMSMVVLVVLALTGMLHCSAAQTVHVVGGDMGWRIPTNDSSAYTTWAANHTFTVGDILEFNFSTRSHDVAQMTKEAYDTCETSSPISIVYIGPANITLEAPGEYYFICTFNRHCGAGQKFSINVTGASSPSPAPAPIAKTPTPQPEPTPAPSRSPMIHTVGDAMGWLVPPGGAIAYQTWALNHTFLVGDTLVFNFTEGDHDVAEVTKTAFRTCDSNTTISSFTISPARITLTTPGEHFYLCTYPNHCLFGQQLAINVTGTASTIATPPSTSTVPSTPSPTGSTTPPTPGNHAPSFAAAGFSATFLSIAVAYLLN